MTQQRLNHCMLLHIHHHKQTDLSGGRETGGAEGQPPDQYFGSTPIVMELVHCLCHL